MPPESVVPATFLEHSNQPFIAVIRTNEELTLVGPTSLAPSNAKSSHDWRCFHVVETMEFDVVGVIAAISHVLAKSKIPIFSLSTYNTDYFLIADQFCERAKSNLIEAGYTLTEHGKDE